MGSLLGSAKTVSRHLGMTLGQYLDLKFAGMKRCLACKQWMPKEQFYTNAYRPDGRSVSCIPCNREESRKRKARRKSAS